MISSKRSVTAVIVAALAAGLLAASAMGGVISYVVPPSQAGNQAHGGGLGMDFNVDPARAITVTRLGIFDDGSNGLSLPLTAYLWDRTNTAAPLATLNFTSGDPGTLVGGSRFKALSSPITLPAGFKGTISADGYGAAELNGNVGNPPWTTNSGGGALAFVGTSRWAPGPGVYPPNLDAGPVNRYAAGTFEFDAPAAPLQVPPQATYYAQTVLNDTPTGYWRLGETSYAHSAADMANGNPGTYVAGAIVGGPGAIAFDPDRAVRMEDTLGYVQVPDAPSLNITGDLAVEFWYRKTSEAGDWQRIVGKGDTNNRTYGVWEEGGGGGRLLFQQYNSGGEVLGLMSNTSIPVSNNWTHVVATVQGNTAQLYINGRLDATGTRSGAPSTSTDPLTIGYAGIHTYFPGSVDEVALYAHSLGTSQALAHYAAGLGVMPGLVPSPWVSEDIGNPARAGFGGYVPPTDSWILEGGGNDVWDNADQFQYVHRPWSGDFNVIVRLTGQERADGWSKTGIMARETTAAGSRQTNLSATPDSGVSLQWRDTTDGGSGWGGAIGGSPNSSAAPYWLALSGRRDPSTGVWTINGRWAPDLGGNPGDWSAPQTHTLLMPNDIQLGLHDTSHNAGAISTATYDHLILGNWAPVATLTPGTGSYYAGVFGQAFAQDRNSPTQAYGPVHWKLERMLPAASAASYVVPAGTDGLQQYGGPLGMAFNINSPILVDQLGVFDDLSNGLFRPISVRLYDRTNPSSPLATLAFSPADPGTLIGGSRFKPLATSVYLPAGFQGMIVADGYGAGEDNGNFNVGGQHPWSTNNGGGALSFLNSWWGSTPGTYPANPDGPYADQYAAGTFLFSALTVSQLLAEGWYNVGDPAGPGYFGVWLGQPETYYLKLTTDFGGDQAIAYGVFTGTPEPATLTLLALGGLGLLRRRRRGR